MGRFIWTLILLVLSVWLGLQIAKDPGLALFVYRHWSIEMPLWLALLLFILIIGTIYFFWSFLGGIDTAWYRWKNWLRWRRKHKAYSKTNRGLIELIEGHWKNAVFYLKEGIPQSDAPLFNYLALAKATHELKQYDRCDYYLRQAYASNREAEVAIGLAQAQLQIEQGKIEQALATLGHLRNLWPHHPRVLKLLERVYMHVGDWQQMIELLPSLYKSGSVTKEQYSLLQKKVYQEFFSTVRVKQLEELEALWSNVPRKLKTEPSIVCSYLKKRLTFSNDTIASLALINTALKKAWYAPLVALYGELPSGQPQKQLAQAEKWLQNYPNQPVLLQTLGHLCVRCQLWGKARSYFMESLKQGPSPETYVAYGELLEQLGDSALAMRAYHDGLFSLCKHKNNCGPV